ncbi:MAG: phosphoglycerate kinase, partial [Firmicutes bacterium]|nr:phosphoglycerate kinase [Bacillota bacterium]
DTESIIVDSDKIPDCWQGLDIGPKTIEIFCNELENAGSVVWNGPMGVSEWENFSYGTYSLAKVLAKSSADTVVGGGDVAAAVNKFGFSSDMYHISTGGGASLMFLGGKDLPGITALHNSNVAEVF